MIDNDIITGFVPIALLSNKEYRHLLNGPGCYLIKHVSTGKFYIGSTNDLRQRIKDHRHCLSRNMHRSKSLQLDYNNDPTVIYYVRPVDTRETAHSVEQSLLDEYFGESFIYNLAPSAYSQQGIKRTPETIAKMSLASLGSKHTPEAKARMKAYQNTPEAKARMSESRTGKPKSAETREKLSLANTGKKRSPETIAKMKAYRNTPEHRARMSEVNTGKIISPEHRAKLSLANTGKKLSPETIAKLKAYHNSPEAKARMRAVHMGRKHSPEAIAKMSLATIGRKHTPEAIAKMSKPRSAEARANMSSARKAYLARKHM